MGNWKICNDSRGVLAKSGAMLVASILGLSIITESFAASQAGSLKLPPEKLASVEVAPKQKFMCGFMDAKGIWLPGKLAKDGSTFLSFKTELANLKRDIKKASGKKRSSMQKRMTLLSSALIPKGGKACKSLAAPPQSSPTTPPGTPQPTATSTPRASAGCYDSQRNTQCFGIRSTGLIGNEIRGQQIFPNCSGCHSGPGDGGRRDRVFSAYKNALRTIPEMIPYQDSFSDQDLADIAAYLNRYNINQNPILWP